MKITKYFYICLLLYFFDFKINGLLYINFSHSHLKNKYIFAYEQALKNIYQNIDHKNSVFHAGKDWNQVWTRDGSYSIDLACGILFPEVSKRTLQKCTTKIEKGKYVALQRRMYAFWNMASFD